MEPTPKTRKRATTEDNIGCNTQDFFDGSNDRVISRIRRNKRLSFHTPNEKEVDRLKNDIYTHIVSKFGNYKGRHR